MKITGCVINRVESDQTSLSRASDLGLHCLEYFKSNFNHKHLRVLKFNLTAKIIGQ